MVLFVNLLSILLLIRSYHRDLLLCSFVICDLIFWSVSGLAGSDIDSEILRKVWTLSRRVLGLISVHG